MLRMLYRAAERFHLSPSEVFIATWSSTSTRARDTKGMATSALGCRYLSRAFLAGILYQSRSRYMTKKIQTTSCWQSWKLNSERRCCSQDSRWVILPRKGGCTSQKRCWFSDVFGMLLRFRGVGATSILPQKHNLPMCSDPAACALLRSILKVPSATGRRRKMVTQHVGRLDAPHD